MPEYRLFLTARDGHIARALEYECDSDEEAMKVAGEYDSQYPMELWNLARRVRAYPGSAAPGTTFETEG